MRQQPAQRTRAKIWIEALRCQCLQHLIRPGQRNLHLALQPLIEPLQQDRGNLLHLLLRKRLEHHDIIDTVQELRPEIILQQLLHRPLGLLEALVQDLMRAQIRRHDDDRILEIHHPALAIRQAAIIKDLQQHVEHIAVCLLDLIQQNDTVWTAAHCLRELAALIVADIARRRTDEPRHRMLLHVLTHIDADHTALIIKQRLRQRLGELRLADTRRTEENERADWPVRILDARPGPEDCLAHHAHRLILPDHALMQHILQVDELLPLARQHLRNRDTRPAADHLRDIFLADFLLQQAGILRLRRNDLLLILKFLLQRRQPAVLDFRSLLQIAAALRELHLMLRIIHFLFDGPHAQDSLLLRIPTGLQLFLLGLEPRLLLSDRCQAGLGAIIRFLLQRLLLDFQLHDLAAHLIDRRRHRLDLRTQLCRGLIDEVDSLIRQEAVRNIAIRQRRR